MAIIRRTLAAAALLTATGCIVFVGPRDADGELRDLVAAKARWNTSGVSDYDMVVRALCFCVYGGQEVRVTVRAGRVTTATLVQGGQSLPTENYYSVEGLFDLIENAVERNAKEIDATYDSARGYPRLFQIDYSEMIADEEYGHEIVSFQPVSR